MCRVQQLFPSASRHASPSHKQTLTGSHSIYPHFKPLMSPGRKLCRMLFLFCPFHPSNLCASHPTPVTKQKMACPQVTPRWVRRVQASHCTPPSPRAREESPSSTALTPTTTCRPKLSHETPPSLVKGETQNERQKELKKYCYN